MDEVLPYWLRNNYFFMYPFFYYWFKGKKIDLYMRFKTLVKDMTENEIREVYRELDCRAKDRGRQLNSADFLARHPLPEVLATLAAPATQSAIEETMAQMVVYGILRR